MYPVALAEEDVDPNTLSRESLIEELRDDVVKAYDEREEELGEELMRALERYILLQIIDERWREHLHDMDYLREGIHLRGFAQIEPIVAYKNDGFEMFRGLINSIWEEFARFIFHVEVEVEGQNGGGGGGARAGPAARRWAVGGGSSSSSTGGYRTPAAARTSRARWRRRRPARCPTASRALPTRPSSRRPRADRAAQALRGRADRAQRPLLVRIRQEVQEVPWRLAPVASATS